jgi:hypothetical protein
VDAYSPQPWHDLFVAGAGAAAALTGLVFVAVSVNLKQILAYTGLAERALQTLALLLSVVFVSLIALIPGQSSTALGIELLAVSATIDGAVLALLIKTLPAAREYERAIAHLALVLPGTVPLLIGGVSLIVGGGGGLYWIVAGMLGAVLGAAVNAWVLLVEIVR